MEGAGGRPTVASQRQRARNQTNAQQNRRRGLGNRGGRNAVRQSDAPHAAILGSFNAIHAATCTARHGVRSQAEPIELVARCSTPAPSSARRRNRARQ